MKKLLYATLALGALLASSCSNKQQPEQSSVTTTGDEQSYQVPRKYGIKSGILVFTVENSMVKFNMQRKVYFDDYGAKETAEVFTNNILVDKIINKGDGSYYQIGVKDGSGTKSKNPAANGTELKFDMSETAWPASARKDYNFTRQPDETICGKTCEVYTTEYSGIKARYAGWNGILFLLETESPMGNSVLKTSSRLIEFQENVTIPESVWEVPAGVNITGQ